MRSQIFILAARFLTAQMTLADEIKFGFMGPVTGNEAGEMKMLTRAVELAAKQVNSNGGIGGKKIKIITADTKSGPATALEAYEKLLKEEKVAAVIAPWKSAQIVAMVNAMKKGATPTIIGGTNPRLTEDGKWFFRTRPDDNIVAAAMVQYLKNEMKITKIGIVHDNGAFGYTGGNLVEKNAAQSGLQVVKRIGFELGARDFSNAMKSIKDAGAQALIVYAANIGDQAAAEKEWAKIGRPFSYLGSPSSASQTTIEDAAGAAEGVFAVVDFVFGQTPVNQKYADAFRADYHGEPDTIAAYAYDGMMILSNAMNKVGENKDKVREEIMGLNGYEGVVGKYSFAPKGDGLHSVTIVKIQAGKPKAIKVVNVQ